MNLSLWDSSIPFLIKGNKMAYMNYEELVEFISNEESGIAKGYNFQFLRDMFRLDEVKQTIQNDLKIFGEIEKSLLSQSTPKEGDFVNTMAVFQEFQEYIQDEVFNYLKILVLMFGTILLNRVVVFGIQI